MKKVYIFLLALVIGGVGFLISWYFVKDVFTGVVIGGILALGGYNIMKNRFSPISILTKEVKKHLSNEVIACFYGDNVKRKLSSKDAGSSSETCSLTAITNERIYQKDSVNNTETDIPLESIKNVEITSTRLTVSNGRQTLTLDITNGSVDTLYQQLTSQQKFPQEVLKQSTSGSESISR